MSEQLVSSYAASRLLGRDRQTIERAVRYLAPDAYKGNRPRWYLSRIADAVAKTPQQRRETGRMRDRYRIADKALDGLLAEFERQVAAIGAEPSPDERREMALALAPLLQQFQMTYLHVSRSLRIADDDAICARAELIWSEMMDEISAAAQWPRYGSDFFAAMLEAVPHDDDDDEGVA